MENLKKKAGEWNMSQRREDNQEIDLILGENHSSEAYDSKRRNSWNNLDREDYSENGSSERIRRNAREYENARREHRSGRDDRHKMEENADYRNVGRTSGYRKTESVRNGHGRKAHGKKAASRRRRNTIFIIEIVLLLVLAVVLFIVSKLGKIEKTELDMDKIEVNENISEESMEIMKGYQTIALFGLDNRSNGNLNSGRSDVIMLANINNDTKEVKLVSVYRDSYLDVGNGSFQKCNAAYAKGGPEQAISMLNVNLDLNITDYVTVDFNAIIECVDLLGGVELELTDTEAVLTEGYIRELNELTGNKAEYLSGGGVYNLDGVQACAYARIRYGGGDDYHRTERQRAVLMAMVKKAQKSDPATVNKLINEVCGDIQTSFSNTELLSLASQIFNYSIGETTGFPFTKATTKLGKKGDVVVPCDLSTNVKQLHQFLYNDEAYTVSDIVAKNSEKITADTGFKTGDGY